MKTKLQYLFAAFALALGLEQGFAEIPAGYYNSLNGLRDAELKTAVFNLVRNFTSVSSYNNLPSYFRRTDVRPGTQYWWDMYSDMDVNINISFGTYMNREHSFPKSWWGGSQTVKAYTDLNHLYPGEAAANMAKSNYPLGEVRTPKFNNGVTKVGSPQSGQGGGSAMVFEPDNEYKGDFARTYFYMVTCYQDYTWVKNYMFMLQDNTYPTLNQWSIDLLLKWARNDQVSQKEIDRNEQVWQIQNNRNPFIDFPELAEYIWGNKKGEAFKVETSTAGKAILSAPVAGTTLEFGQVAKDYSAKTLLYVHGENLKRTLTAIVFGTNKSMFALSSSTITASAANAGYWLEVTYNPKEVGTHEAKIQIICDDIDSAPPVVTLRGECLEVPTLTACTALDPSNIEEDSYDANWSTPDDEVVDYWIITRTKYNGTSQTVEEVMAEKSPWTITDFAENEYESYAVQSVRLGLRSPMSNTVFVRRSGINGVVCDEPLKVIGFPGMMRFECANPQTDCKIYDITGRLVMTIDRVELDTDIEMPLGVYFITTAQHHTPIKVSIR